ncbi:MAG TPA: AMP-dependent synthetase/ligase [Streptosporangiaceae bacterium]|nr:AMP-dependent synthetase/ligase [Streptosporangiaceae bacterium]
MSDSILADRADIEAAVSGQTLCDLLATTVAEYGELPAYSDRDGDAPWETLTWKQTSDTARELAAALVSLGLQAGDRVAFMLPNRLEHVLADYAALHAGGVPVTFYATLAPDQIKYVAGDCGVRIVVLDGAAELARWQPLLDDLPGITKVIVRDAQACPATSKFMTWAQFAELGKREAGGESGAEVARRTAAIKPADPATLLYTSGTTGNPKGVIITHGSVLYECMTAKVSGSTTMHVRWVSYLPLAHIAERMFTLYLASFSAGHTYFCHNATTDLVRTVGEVKPTAFFGVPRVWEKIQAGIQALLTAEQDETRKAAVAAAMEVGRRYVHACEYGQTLSDELAAEFAEADASVLGLIKGLLGLADATVVVSAAAPLPPEVGAFFAGLGMKILDVYGMTETTGAFTTNTPTAFKLGTVGRAVPGIEVKIADDGEILARGPLNTPGYLNLPDQTTDLLDKDGWLHTGDIGTIDEDGFVSVIDRKKELIITSGGENISPAAVENVLVANPLIGQALAYGDRRKYVVALLTLDGEVAPAWAKARGIEATSLAELAENETVLAAVAEAVEDANKHLARVQQVKRWRLLPVEWTAESEELTPTFKLKRRIIHRKYADIIDSLYAESPDA